MPALKNSILEILDETLQYTIGAGLALLLILPLIT